jgi:hypothetical protein
MDIENNNVIDVKVNAWSTKRTLLLIACIDFIFNLLASLFTESPVYFIVSLVILLGIYGLQQYKYCLSTFYGVYLIFQVLVRFILLFYIDTSTLFIIFTYCIIVFDIWIFWLLKKFLGYLKVLSDEELDDLRNGWAPNVFTVIYY